ncbi:SDR family oxidoreductase [Spirosoma radiotolerans]|uniref:Nucleoside-diphosphate sugar epimerase n=1 Tax=Spirosoma radiotolerans TaxID=1379870 RepID=A0A0E3V6W2_9BACT|nr:aldehyde reductase [Spirosoma radiotolerans]AKD54886.1 nucleoside-diphosphate sugar epimerase [Spirosoma radiotolerans]
MNVLVTGVSGFLGSHTTIQLLEKGYQVVGTLRDIRRANDIRAIIGQHTKNINQLTFAEADLTDPAVWDELVEGADFVQHIASPFPHGEPAHEADVIMPAKEGTLAILKAASKHQLKRVVLTSAIGASFYGKPKGQQSGVFDEMVWTDETNRADTTAYYRSKTIAEKAAWAFMEQDTSGLELTTVLPGALLGPVLEKDYGHTPEIILNLLKGSVPAIPGVGFDLADVRSVADLLLRAMEFPQAAGQRFLGTAGYLSFRQIAALLKENYPDRKIPTGTVPNWLLRLLGRFDPSLAAVIVDLDKVRQGDSTKARQLLNWQPIDSREAVLSCAESMFRVGLMPK